MAELQLDQRELRGPLVGKGDSGDSGDAGHAGDSVYVSGTVPAPSPWQVGQAVAVYAVQERPKDPAHATVRCAAEVVLVSDLRDGRVRVFARANGAERGRLDRQNWTRSDDAPR